MPTWGVWIDGAFYTEGGGRTVRHLQANPHVVVHVAVWEPYSRAAPATARQLTDDAATSILGAAAECRALESIIVRRGLEVYGRRRNSVTRTGRF